MTSAEINQQIEELVSFVWRKGGAVAVVPFFLEAMKKFEYLEDDVVDLLRYAKAEGKLDINNSWQVITPK